MIYIQGSNKEGTIKQRGITNRKVVPSFTFPGGEQQITLPDFNSHIKIDHIDIIAQLITSKDVMDLVLIKDALESKYNANIDLHLGYMPYARQDRIANDGESLAARAFARLINSLHFNNVIVLDPHSEIGVSYLHNVVIIDQLTMLMQSYAYKSIINKEVLVVAPDKGSTQKVLDIVLEKPFIQGFKFRDTKTGKLSGFGYDGDVEGKDLLIIDDICDGGGTFLGLTKELLDGGAKSVSLYVTHGIFSKGLDILLDNGIDHIYTTNSLPQKEHEKLTILYWR